MALDSKDGKGGLVCAAQVIKLLPPHTRVALLTFGSCVSVYRLASEGPVVADVLPAIGPLPSALVQRLHQVARHHLGPLSGSAASLQRALESFRSVCVPCRGASTLRIPPEQCP